MATQLTTDSDKRGKIILVAFVVTFLAFFLKIAQQSDKISIYQVYLNATLVGFVAYIGLLWAIKFQVTLRSMVYVLSQSALIVFILTLFLEMFVFRRVGRVYEFLILLLVLGLMFLGTYGSFLMANIFNVAHFYKEIPLVQVGKTTSLILTVFSIYFSTYVVLESGISSVVTILLLSVMICLLLILHVRHLEIPRNVLWKRVSTIFLFVLLSLFIQIVVGSDPLISATVPAIVSYSLINMITLENLTQSQKIEYFVMTFGSFALSFFVR